MYGSVVSTAQQNKVVEESVIAPTGGPGLGDEGTRRLSANPRQDHPSITP
jgi:hypothetical protein